MTEGTPVIYHGGWNHEGVKCAHCDFLCGFQYRGRIVGPYPSDKDELWEAQIETGAFVVGYADQFQII